MCKGFGQFRTLNFQGAFVRLKVYFQFSDNDDEVRIGTANALLLNLSSEQIVNQYKDQPNQIYTLQCQIQEILENEEKYLIVEARQLLSDIFFSFQKIQNENGENAPQKPVFNKSNQKSKKQDIQNLQTDFFNFEPQIQKTHIQQPQQQPERKAWPAEEPNNNGYIQLQDLQNNSLPQSQRQSQHLSIQSEANQEDEQYYIKVLIELEQNDPEKFQKILTQIRQQSEEQYYSMLEKINEMKELEKQLEILRNLKNEDPDMFDQVINEIRNENYEQAEIILKELN